MRARCRTHASAEFPVRNFGTRGNNPQVQSLFSYGKGAEHGR